MGRAGRFASWHAGGRTCSRRLGAAVSAVSRRLNPRAVYVDADEVEPASIESIAAEPIRRRGTLRLPARVIGVVVVSVLIWLAIWHLLADRSDRQAIWQGIIVPTATLLLLVMVAVRHERYWTKPMRQLRDVLREVREGRAAIESLAEISGGAARLVPELRALLHDLRQQRQENRQLVEEMRHRVAGRTDALERRLGSLREQATRDALTGLRNRRALEEEYPRLFESCKAGGTDLCVAMIDLDHFKALNDTLGHARGDELLRSVGQLIRSTIRDGDLAYRYGGDEFVLVLPGGSVSAGESLCRRLESLLDGLVKPLRLPLPPRLCAGVSSMLEAGSADPQGLLDASDKKLYDLKFMRKNSLRSNTSAA